MTVSRHLHPGNHRVPQKYAMNSHWNIPLLVAAHMMLMMKGNVQQQRRLLDSFPSSWTNLVFGCRRRRRPSSSADCVLVCHAPPPPAAASALFALPPHYLVALMMVLASCRQWHQANFSSLSAFHPFFLKPPASTLNRKNSDFLNENNKKTQLNNDID